MKIVFLAVGKPHDVFVKSGVDDYTRRIGKYFPVLWQLLPAAKGNLPEAAQKAREGEAILSVLNGGDLLVALDERGRSFASESLSGFVQECANNSAKRLVFAVGGAYGLSDAVLQKAARTWSLSALTFPHQLVRLILAEQIYRACTILRNEKYHHG